MKGKDFYAYIRTSTVKQGTEGVSLEVQEEQARWLARLKGIEISKVFSEMETAAKQGRPVFAQMMRGLRAGEAAGLILHKVDRGARNLREWSEITDLIELGIPVLFVQDSSLNLATRGGRLQGDIQAVIAADYIRNLREETVKGLVGRLNQGIWPFGAPFGYVNNGKGKPKTIDPVNGPLVRQAFELYATGEYTIKMMRSKLHALGLRASNGKPLSRGTFTTVLRNPFYYGALTFRSTGEVYAGIHEPLVSRTVFDNVQAVLNGRTWKKAGRHAFLYRGEIRCGRCGYGVLGERQKSWVYYRCHSKQCAGTSFREERVDQAVRCDLELLLRFVEAYPQLESALEEAVDARQRSGAEALQALLLKRAKLDDRLVALTDALLDGLIDKETFKSKKNDLESSKIDLAQSIARCEKGQPPTAPYAEYYLELVELLRRKAFLESPYAARGMTRFGTSNFIANGKTVSLQWVDAFKHVLEHAKSIQCGHARAEARTLSEVVGLLMSDAAGTSATWKNVPRSPRHETPWDSDTSPS